MPKTIAIQAYSYPELSGKAKDKVRYWVNEDLSLFDQWEKEYWEEELAKLGYSNCDFAYSVSYSQGDGASIACDVNVQNFIKRHKLGKKYQSLLYWVRKVYEDGGTISIKRSNQMRYVHDKMLYADANELSDYVYDYNKSEELQKQITELEEMILEEVQEQSRKLYDQLCKENDWQYSDEYVLDFCGANEYFFDEYGDPVHHLELENISL